MRRTRSARALTLPLLAALMGTSLVAPAAHASAPTTTVVLPIGHADSVAAAGTHVLVSQGKGHGDTVLVRNTDGSDAGVIAGLPGASGMVASADGSVVYVALADGDAIAVVGAATLMVTGLIPTGVGSCPRTVATENGRVYFGADCSASDSQGVVGTFTPAGRTVVATGFYGAPRIAASNVIPNAVFVGQPSSSPGSVSRYDLAPTGGNFVRTATVSSPDNCDNLGDLTVAADGWRVVLACGYPYHHIMLSATTLSVLTSAQTFTPYPDSVATTADGILAEGSDHTTGVDVLLLDEVGTQVGGVDFTVPNEALIPHGMSWGNGGQTLYAVSDEWTGSAVNPDIIRLNVTATSITRRTLGTLTAPTTAVVDAPLHLSGSLRTNVGGLPVAGRSVSLRRAGLSVTVVTGPDGTWSYDDVPPLGTVNYEAYFAGDALASKADNLATVSVVVQSTSLSATGPATIPAGTTMHITGQLSVTAPGSAGGRAVAISRGSMVTMVTTAADGTYTFDDTSLSAGTYSYTAAYAGDAKTASSSATLAVTAVAVVSSLTLSAATPVTLPAPVHLMGTLSIGSTAGGNRPVVITRGGVSVTVTTAADGTFWVEDAAPVGTFAYTASFAGDAVTASATAVQTVSVIPAVSTVSLSAPSTVVATSAVHLAGRVTISGAWAGGRSVTLMRSGVVLATVTTASDGTFAWDDAAGAGSYVYTASFAGDGSTAASSASQNVSVILATSSVSIATSVSAVNHKTTITVTAHLTGGRTNRSVTIYAKVGTGARAAIGSGVVNASGNFAVNVWVSATTSFSTDYTGDATYGSSTSTVATVTYK